MKPILYLTLALVLPPTLSAQDDIPLLMPEERQAVDAQAAQLSEAITPALATVAKSTVRVWAGNRRIAYGTVIGDGTKILSKWSEVARASGNLRVDVAGAEYRSVKPAGVYQDEDLVVLEVEGSPLTPVRWSKEVPKLGSFLAAPQPDGRLAAFGVVSVLERNLKDTDLAYLGVIGDPEFRGQGVKIAKVAEDSGALAAGLRPGNVILKVGDRAISGLLALRNALTGVAPGATISLLVESGGKAQSVNVLLGNRPKMAQFSGERLQQMERMGGAISQVRDSFTHAIQTDMRPKVNQIGGPVVDLKGQVVGITVARADRTRSFIMPSAAVVNLLKKDAQNPALAQVRTAEEEAPMPTRGGMAPRGMAAPGGEERMRRHLTDMQRLMDHLRDEMNAIDEP
ncbi:MAG: PDZ domain-containing protein [Verrucomicrobiota bacterium]